MTEYQYNTYTYKNLVTAATYMSKEMACVYNSRTAEEINKSLHDKMNSNLIQLRILLIEQHV